MRGRHRPPGSPRAVDTVNPSAARARRQRRAVIGEQLDARAFDSRATRQERRGRGSNREQLPSASSCSGTPSSQKGDRFADGQGAQDLANDGGAAPEVAVRDNRIGDVAARAAADENLRAGSFCGVEEGDAQRGGKAACEDRGRQAGRAGADDRHVAGQRGAQSSCQSRASFWKSSTNPWIIDTTGWVATA